MKTNKQELNILNNKKSTRHAKKWRANTTLIDIISVFMHIVYGITCIVCSTIEAVYFVLCILTIPHRRKRRRKKGWF